MGTRRFLLILLLLATPAHAVNLPYLCGEESVSDAGCAKLPFDAISMFGKTNCVLGYCVRGIIEGTTNEFDCQPCSGAVLPTPTAPATTMTPTPTATDPDAILVCADVRGCVTTTPTPTVTKTPTPTLTPTPTVTDTPTVTPIPTFTYGPTLVPVATSTTWQCDPGFVAQGMFGTPQCTAVPTARPTLVPVATSTTWQCDPGFVAQGMFGTPQCTAVPTARPTLVPVATSTTWTCDAGFVAQGMGASAPACTAVPTARPTLEPYVTPGPTPPPITCPSGKAMVGSAPTCDFVQTPGPTVTFPAVGTPHPVGQATGDPGTSGAPALRDHKHAVDVPFLVATASPIFTATFTPGATPTGPAATRTATLTPSPTPTRTPGITSGEPIRSDAGLFMCGSTTVCELRPMATFASSGAGVTTRIFGGDSLIANGVGAAGGDAEVVGGAGSNLSGGGTARLKGGSGFNGSDVDLLPAYGFSGTAGRAYVSAGGHLITRGGTPPTVTTCGTSPTQPGATSTDMAGVFTVGTVATACTLGFNKSYTVAPHCFCNDQTTASSRCIVSSTTTSTAVFVTATAADISSDVIDYLCVGGE